MLTVNLDPDPGSTPHFTDYQSSIEGNQSQSTSRPVVVDEPEVNRTACMSFFSPLSYRVYKEIRSPNSQKFLRAESGIGGFDIHNSAQGIQNPVKQYFPLICNPEFITWNLESTTWNPKFKTVLDCLTCSESCISNSFSYS